MIIEAASLTIDLSRARVDEKLLSQFARQANTLQLNDKKLALFNGEEVNTSEKRAAHHTALRDPKSDHPHAVQARQTLERVIALAERIRSGSWKGASGKTINTVINIGIGGSDLGPRMISTALAENNPATRVLFIANIDPSETIATLGQCDPETTLVIVASKSFTTLETLENGFAARRWLLNRVDEKDLGRHLIAVTANVPRAIDYGVLEENILPMWDWVGGRYSLWSAIGLPIAVAIGGDRYRELLQGAHEMDQHFLNEDPQQNAPFLMAMLGIHYQRHLGMQSLAILPYSFRLRLLPDYLQQLCMESNGKSVKPDGSAVSGDTCTVLWGSAGTVGQHSFHQLLHQGTQSFAVDFIFALRGEQNSTAEDLRHEHLIANCLAQSEAFSNGKTLATALQEVRSQQRELKDDEAEQLARQKVIAGGKPNTLIAMDSVNPHALGALISLYEHKTYAESLAWGINAFDQWGVELGKQLSGPIFKGITDGSYEELDPATQFWIDRLRNL